MMKKVLALILAIAVSVIGLSFCVSAAAVVSITTGTIDATNVAANGEISVPLTLSNIVDTAIKGVQIDFSFDKTKLEFVRAKREMQVYNTANSSLVNAVWLADVNTVNLNGGGSIVFVDTYSGTRSFRQQSLDANEKLVTLVFKRKAGVTENSAVTFDEVILNGLSNTEYKVSKGHIDCEDAQIKLVKNTDATLSSLTASPAVLSPAFDSAVYSYTATVPYDTQSVTLAASATDSYASVSSGTGVKNLVTGTNTFVVKCVAQDGVTYKDYTVVITKEAPPAYLSDSSLSALTLEGLSLSPSFSGGTLAYTAATESQAVPEIIATPTVDGATVNIVKPAQFIAGENVITITVTALDSSTSTYTVTVTYTLPADLTADTLSALSVGTIPLTPAFSSDTTHYTGTTDVQTVPEIIAIPTVDGAAVNIQKPEVFSPGRNEILITVTALNGTQKRYSVVITYSSDTPELSSDNTLKELTVKQTVNNKKKEITLSPAFSSGVTTYTGKTESNKKLEIVATANDRDATVTIPEQSTLTKGENKIIITVTAPNGATKTYELKITYSTSGGGGGGGGGGPSGGPGGLGGIPTEPTTPTTPTTPSRPSDKFKDLNGYDWALDAIDKLVTKGIVSGTSATTFEPEKSVTRAEFAKLVVASFGLTLNSDKVISFSDVNQSEWYKQYVDIAVSNGIVTGYENNTFRPDNTITREEMCVMLARALKSYELEDKESRIFADANKVSDWATDAVALLSSHGIINGKGNDMFAPLDNASRAESAVTISRILTLTGK